jgi:uncharacterized caspase-like protein
MQPTTGRLFVTLMATCLPLGAAQSAERGLAIFIANSAYQLNPLKNPVDDANRLKSEFETQLGYTVKSIENGNAAEMRARLDDLKRDSSNFDHVVVYFGGYAMNKDGKNYLMGVDNNDPAHAGRSTLALSEVTDAIHSNVKSATVLLDASYKPTGESFGSDGRMKPGLTKISEVSGKFVIISSQQPDRFSDRPETETGVLARAVSTSLAQDANRKSTFGRWFDSIRDYVRDETQNAQEPLLVASPETRKIKLAALSRDRVAPGGSVTDVVNPLPSLTGVPVETAAKAPELSELEVATALQQRLKRYACLNEPADGKWGAKSRAAVEQVIKSAKNVSGLGKQMRDAGVDVSELERNANQPRALLATFEKFRFDFKCLLEDPDDEEKKPSKPKQRVVTAPPEAPVAPRTRKNDDDEKSARKSSPDAKPSSGGGGGGGSKGPGYYSF